MFSQNILELLPPLKWITILRRSKSTVTMSTRYGCPMQKCTTRRFMIFGAGSSRFQPILLTRKALSLKPTPLSDNLDADGPMGKYISGLTHVHVDSAKEAKKLIKLGQLHRRVFGTLANSQSSRSHGIVTIKLLRKHRGEKDVSYISQSPNLRRCLSRNLPHT